MPKLEWRPQARADLRAIVAYIADRNRPAALALRDEIRAKVGTLPEHPRLYRTGRVDGTREMVVRPTYVVVYRETPDAVTILRVLHTAREWPWP